MFSWKLILTLVASYSGAQPQTIPTEYLPTNSPPITIQVVAGDPMGDYGQAGRVLGDTENDTLECRISLNRNSKVFRGARESNRGSQGAAMVRHLRDGTIENNSPKLFLLAHEIGHCYDNETLPKNATDKDAEGYRVWKEGYADAFAVLVLKQQGTPDDQLRTLAIFREGQMTGSYGEQWGAMLHQAAKADVVGKSDKNLLAIVSEIRRNTWKSF